MENPTGNDPDALYVTDVVLDRVFSFPLYFDRQGQPITLAGWARLREHGHPDYGPGPMHYKVVARTTVGAYLVSTVWLGIDMSFTPWIHGGPVVIFETMVFLAGEGPAHDFDLDRYCTEQQALDGHRDMVTLVRAAAQTETGEDPDIVEWDGSVP
jgi:hypothetical protein